MLCFFVSGTAGGGGGREFEKKNYLSKICFSQKFI